MKRIYILGLLWLVLGVTSLAASIYKFTSIPTLEELQQAFSSGLSKTVDTITFLYPYLMLVQIIYIILSVAVIFVSYNFIKSKVWSRLALERVTKIYMALLVLYALFGTYIYYVISIDLSISLLSSGILGALLQISVLFIPFIVSLYILKQQKVRAIFNGR